MNLTKAYIERATYQRASRSHDIRWDESLPGFGLRIHPSGKKVFVLRYRFHNRKHLITIGAFGALTVQQARDHAKTKIGQIIGGSDPIEERRREASGDTVGALCEAYLLRHAIHKKKSKRDDIRRLNKVIIPAWKNLKARSILRSDVSALHQKIGHRAPYEANRILALISKIWTLAEQWGCVPEGHPNPTRGIQKFREFKRERFVTQNEMPLLANSIAEEPNHTVRAALWLYLLTGLRKSELLGIKWDSIDFRRRELAILDTKAGRPHYLPISEPANEILISIPRQQENPYVFVGKTPGHHIVNIDKAWQRIRGRANLKDVRIHDLRRTAGSWMAQRGVSLNLIGKVLNHSNLSTTQTYARFNQDRVRIVLDQHANELAAITSKTVLKTTSWDSTSVRGISH